MSRTRRGLFLICLVFITSCTVVQPHTISRTWQPSVTLDPETSPLSGWTIVLDPGHGGRERGAPAEITDVWESEINLAVALLAGGILTDAGAEVIYTRSSDRSVNVPFSGLRQELVSRAAISDTADIFISLHHNSSPNNRFNRSEIYYKLLSQGPAEELATMISSELARLFPASDTAVLAGNFSVLRNCPVESVLVEFSYISNPTIARETVTLPQLQRESLALTSAVLRFACKGNPFIFFGDPVDGLIRCRVSDHLPLQQVSVRKSNGAEVFLTLSEDSHSIEFDVDTSTVFTVTAENISGRQAVAEWAPPSPRKDTLPLFLLVIRDDATEDSPFSTEYYYDSFVIEVVPEQKTPSQTLKEVEKLSPDYTIFWKRAVRPQVTHYFRSRTGHRLAGTLSNKMNIPARPEIDYFLTHTSMAAVNLYLDDSSLLSGLPGLLSDFLDPEYSPLPFETKPTSRKYSYSNKFRL